MTDDTPKAKAPAAKAPAAKAPAVKAPAAKRPAAKKPAAEKPAAAAITPVEPAPTTVAPAVAAATAAAGWYPVAPGSAQQRWWDGTRWTDHVYDPATATPAAATSVSTVPLRAAEGVKPSTVWFWLLAVGAPVLQSLDLIPASFWVNSFLGANFDDPSAIIGAELNPAYFVLLLCGFAIYAFCIVFAALDWRELKARGVPQPFHWAWSFFVFAVGIPVVYVIGRTVVVRRRTGSGVAPLWVFVGLEVATFIVSIVFAVYVFIEFVNIMSNGLAAAGNVF